MSFAFPEPGLLVVGVFVFSVPRARAPNAADLMDIRPKPYRPAGIERAVVDEAGVHNRGVAARHLKGTTLNLGNLSCEKNSAARQERRMREEF
jgi:hypothetical protein